MRGEGLAPTYLTLVWNKISKLSINLDTCWRCRIEWDRRCPQKISRSAFAENKLRNGLIETVVKVGVIHLLILVVLHSDDIEDMCLVWPLSQSSMYWPFPLPFICWLFISYFPNSLNRFSTPLIWTFGERGSLERDVWIYSNWWQCSGKWISKSIVDKLDKKFWLLSEKKWKWWFLRKSKLAS